MYGSLEKVYQALLNIGSDDGATTVAIAEQLELSRSVVSNYLNQLAAQGMILKIPGRPVRWRTNLLDSTANTDPFNLFIGSQGSLHGVTKQCTAAVAYPPNGLNILITGHSGTGKSYLANTIVSYARHAGTISEQAPYVVLNCANYANNPELLSSLLFGYTRGAFTGAETDKIGLLKQADGGFLFLDEVHRLSSENQEKLFNFIDNGHFYRLGDNNTAIRATVRLILATTEAPKEVLLATFRRRIPVVLQLSDYAQRPVDERLTLLQSILTAEAKKMNISIAVQPTVVSALSQINHPGNIGYLKNTIQVGCAMAYEQRHDSDQIQLDLNCFQFDTLPQDKDYGSLMIAPTSPASCPQFDQFNQALSDIIITATKDADNLNQENIRRLTNSFQLLIGKIPKWELNVGFHVQHRNRFEALIQHRFGLNKTGYLESLIFSLYRRHFKFNATVIDRLTSQLKIKTPRALHVAQEFYRTIQPLEAGSHQTLILVLALLLADHIDENIQLRGLLIAHGESTATSIQAVVNSLCGTYVFDAIDMPIATGVDSIIKEANRLIDQSNTTNGFILMVDMGSLSQLYSAIKSHLDGDLLVVNNLTTVTALDLALKMQQSLPFKEIAEKSDENYTIDVQYYEGFSQTTNILVSCISGLGIAEKIHEIMQPLMPNDIKVIPLDYATLKEKIIAEEWPYFEQTLFVLTTMDLPKDIPFAHLNIYDLLDTTGTTKLTEWLHPYLSQIQLTNLNAQLLRFFSIEGISERLSFLNPDIVIREVETTITKYENYYDLSLDGKVKLNLYMHIALMIERLMVRKQIDTRIEPTTSEGIEFMQISHSIFQPIELKYNVQVSDYEISLLYELFKQFISV